MSTVEMFITRAYAASEAYAGAACIFNLISKTGDKDSPINLYHRKYSLYLKTKSLIDFDRAVTNDQRGVGRILPPIS